MLVCLIFFQKCLSSSEIKLSSQDSNLPHIPNLPHPNLPLCPIYPPQIMTKHLCFSPNYYTYFEGGLTSHIKRKENRYKQ